MNFEDQFSRWIHVRLARGVPDSVKAFLFTLGEDR